MLGWGLGLGVFQIAPAPRGVGTAIKYVTKEMSAQRRRTNDKSLYFQSATICFAILNIYCSHTTIEHTSQWSESRNRGGVRGLRGRAGEEGGGFQAFPLKKNTHYCNA